MDDNDFAPPSWTRRQAVTERTGIGMSTLRRYEKTKGLRAKKDADGLVRIHPEDVERLVAELHGGNTDRSPVASSEGLADAGEPTDATAEEIEEPASEPATAPAEPRPSSPSAFCTPAAIGDEEVPATPEGRLTARAFAFLKDRHDFRDMIIALRITLEQGETLYDDYMSAIEGFPVLSEDRQRLHALCRRYLPDHMEISDADGILDLVAQLLPARAKLQQAQERIEELERQLGEQGMLLDRYKRGYGDLHAQREGLQADNEELAARLEDTEDRLRALQAQHLPLTQWAHRASKEHEVLAERMQHLEDRVAESHEREALAHKQVACAQAETTLLLHAFLNAPRSMDDATRAAYIRALCDVHDRFVGAQNTGATSLP